LQYLYESGKEVREIYYHILGFIVYIIMLLIPYFGGIWVINKFGEELGLDKHQESLFIYGQIVVSVVSLILIGSLL